MDERGFLSTVHFGKELFAVSVGCKVDGPSMNKKEVG